MGLSTALLWAGVSLPLLTSCANIPQTPIPSSSSSASSPVFTIPASADEGAPLLPNIEDPEAVNAQKVCPGYIASDVEHNQFGFTATLSLAGKACNAYGTDIETLNLEVAYQAQDRLNVNIQPANISPSNQSHYILPEDFVHKPGIDYNETTAESDLIFHWSNEPTFSFTVVRKSTGDVIFSTEGTVLVYENQFIEFVSSLPENYNLYGLGERIHGLRLGNNFTATIYAADIGDPIDENIYGSYPFYLDTRYYEVDSDTEKLTLVTDQETDPSKGEYLSYSHGVYLRNAHGQEVLLRPENVTWRTLGGSIDLYFFSGPSQPEVTKSYLASTGGFPAMQQYFTLGFHQARWGYGSWSELEEVVSNFEKFDIPLEGLWSDIDYMKKYRDFDHDPETHPYSEGKEFMEKLHAGGRHWIPIVDAALYIPNPDDPSDTYETYNRGDEAQVFMRNPDGSTYIGAVWPGYTVYTDWLAEGANEFWMEEIAIYHEKVGFSGIWLDMNEVSSFCVGSCGSGNLTLNPVHPPFQLPGEPGNVVYDYPEGFELTNATEASSASSASSKQEASKTEDPSPTSTEYLRTTPTPGVRNVNHPPYVINHVQGDLAVHAISPNATHADDSVEYDLHSLYGHMSIKATYDGLLKVFEGKRPFIIARSTFPGSGTMAGHWGGDNTSLWAYMFFSIPQALSFSLFGIPMFGVDTCGFNGNSDEELCNRWMQLSAFFPFYRNHNVLSAISQEPYVWSSVIDASKSAMEIRYALLPYMYTLFYLSHTTGSTVMRALSWEYPNDPTLATVDTQFLLGPSLMIVPVLAPQADTVDGVFPGIAEGELWYDWYNQTAVNAAAGVNTTIEAPLGHIPVYVRGGSVLPMQEPALTTRDARKSPWSLLASLDGEGEASGQLYVDDGESVSPEKTLNVEFSVTECTLAASSRGTFSENNPLSKVTVLGVSEKPSSITFNDVKLPGSSISYNETSQVLSVCELEKATDDGAWAKDWVLKW